MKRDRDAQSVPVVFDVRGAPLAREVDWPGAPSASPPDRFLQAALLRAQVGRYFSALRRRWWIPTLSLLLLGGPAVFYAVVTPPRYQSEAVMYMGARLNLPEGRLYAEELSSYLGTQTELIRSPTVEVRALRKLGTRFPGFAISATNSGPGRLRFDLSVSTSPKSSTLGLRAVGPSPELTRAYLDQIMEEYLGFKQESRTLTSANALSSITDQIKEVKRDIEQIAAKMIAFQMSNNVPYLTESGASAGSHLARLTELISDLRTEYRLLGLLTPDQVASIPEDSAAAVSGVALPGERMARALSATVAAQRAGYYQALQQLQLLKTRRDDFSRDLRPTHSKMVKLNQEISALEQLLKTIKDEGEQQALAQMANRRQSLELQIQNLESQYRSWETNAVEASRRLAEFDRLKQDGQRSQALYDRLVNLVQSVDLNKSLDQEPLSVLTAASAARRTRTPVITAVGGIFLACVVGVGLVLLLEFFSDRFTSVKELSLHLDEEVVGQIPDSRVVRSNRTSARLVTRLVEEHAFAEAFRSLRSSLLFTPGQAARPKVILVTSAVPKEGKTTVSANLAATLATAGARVLLVDADLRRSSLHRIFEVGLQPGLWEVLNQAATPAQAVVATKEANLWLLPAGDAQATGSEIFLRYPVERLLRELAGQYDYTLVDSAPVLATDDAATLGPNTDGVFMVVRAGHTGSRMVREALDRLLARHTKILGMVLNRAAPSSDYYCRYSRDYYGARGRAARK